MSPFICIIALLLSLSIYMETVHSFCIHLVNKNSSAFYPRDAMLARVIAIATCLSVCLSVRLSVRHAPVLCQNEES